MVTVLKEYWSIGLTSLFICWLVRNHFCRCLHRIPGPLIRGTSCLPRLWSVYRGKSHEDDLELHKSYGKLVRLAPNTLSLNDPGEISALYGVSTKFYKSAFYSVAEGYDDEGLLPDPFVLTNREVQGRMKRNAANAYSMNGLAQMEPWMEPVVERLLVKLKQYTKTEEAYNIAPLLRGYAMDAVFAITFGKDWNQMEVGDQWGMLKTTTFMNSYIAIIGQIPWLHPYLLGSHWAQQRLSDMAGNVEMMKLCWSEMELARQQSEESGPLTFLQRLLLNQKENPSGLTDRELITHVFNNIAAGSDTTATALSSVVFHVLKNPHVHQTLKSELREHLAVPVSFSAANKLPYLAAVVREAIRLHPSVGMILARRVPEGGATICGYQLESGVEIGINPWIIQRDPKIYPDPDRFYPERWLPSVTPAELLRDMNRSFLAFGHGNHTCSGRWISTMEILKLVATIFIQFDMDLEENGRTYQFVNHWLTVQSNLEVRFRMA